MIEAFRDGKWVPVGSEPLPGTPEEKTAEHKAFKHAIPAGDVDPWCPECVWYMRYVQGKKAWGKIAVALG